MLHAKPLITASLLGTLLSSGHALAQAWTADATTPGVLNILAVDATGEQNWPFGSEDVAGDGLLTFDESEQQHDLRSAYTDTDSDRLWVRSYVSSSAQPPSTLTLLVFVDSDSDNATGGPATGGELDARLDSEPSEGGYDHVVVANAGDSTPALWDWNLAANAYVESSVTPAQGSIDVGDDIDPLRLGAGNRGFVQLNIDLGLVDTATACESELFIRSLSDDANVGAGDLELGVKSPCVAIDSDSDGIPDPYVPPEDCDSDDDCPLNGECINGECVFPEGCETDDDCSSGEICEDGVCVSGTAGAGGAAGATGAAGSLNSNAGAPTAGTGIVLEEGEEVRGGAFRCSLPRGPVPTPIGLAELIALSLLALRRRGRESS